MQEKDIKLHSISSENHQFENYLTQAPASTCTKSSDELPFFYNKPYMSPSYLPNFEFQLSEYSEHSYCSAEEVMEPQETIE